MRCARVPELQSLTLNSSTRRAQDRDFALEDGDVDLIAITENGELSKPIPSMPALAAEVVDATTQLYASIGYEAPWSGYLALVDGTVVGTCGFKSPPSENRVEIAYFTFPEFESRGMATQMAAALIRIARETTPAVTVAAQTLPEESASTAVLKKLRFRLIETLEHPEDGPVWEWQLSDPAGPPA